ncbi:hypothetical protein [Streptomyces sp. NPDC001450]
MATTPQTPEMSLQQWRAVSPALTRFQQVLAQVQADTILASMSRVLLSFADVQQQMTRELSTAGFATGLSQLISTVEGLRTLSQAQLTTAAAAVEEAYRATPEDDVPEELVAELEDTVRDFTASEAIEYLPIEVSRQQCTLFVGAFIMTSLMTVAFSNETADGILGSVE